MKTNAPRTLHYTLGNDVVYLPDFQKSFNASFVRRVYTIREMDYCDSFPNPVLRYASTFAAKEALYKALKQHNDQQAFPWRCIEIERSHAAGKPTFITRQIQGAPKECSLSLTHDGEYVWALALLGW